MNKLEEALRAIERRPLQVKLAQIDACTKDGCLDVKKLVEMSQRYRHLLGMKSTVKPNA